MRFFCDTNVLVYAFSADSKRERAFQLLLNGPDISVQVLNEFANVSVRKLKGQWDDVRAALALIHLNINAVHPITLETNAVGLDVAERYKLPIYDSMIVSAALITQCDTLYSEDMQDGMVIENRLTIRNPFA